MNTNLTRMSLPKLKKPTHHQVYVCLLALLAGSLSTSKALMSIFPGLLFIHWLWEGGLKNKMKIFLGNPAIWLLVSVFGIYLVGLLWSDCLEWGFHDLKIQVPLLVMPLVIGTSRQLNFREIKIIIWFFTAGVLFASLCSLYVWLGFSNIEIRDVRDISLFISHIRFSLLVNIAIFSLLWFAFNPKVKTPKTEKSIYLIVITWLILFLLILKSFTGIVIFIVVSLVLLLWLSFRIKHIVLKFSLYVFLLMIPVFMGAYLTRSINRFYDIEEISKNELNEKTRLGNSYQHDLDMGQIENGHYVFLFLCQEELRTAWNQLSSFQYDSVYGGGFSKYVLFRYLSSKGLRKDAEGLSKLSDEDIHNIEKGIPNYLFANKISLNNRVYQTIWEIYEYQRGANPGGNSVVQRIEYFKIACQVINEHFWFGAGTGGYFPAYQKKYDEHPFFSDQKFRQRSHNMFLSYWVDFGLVGFTFICFAFVYPVSRQRKTKSYLLLTFSLIVLLSFINEDTLNNHDAITFFALFFSLFLFSNYEDGALAQ